MNKLKVALFVSVAACMAVFASSCKKKGGSAHRVVFKAHTSSEGNIKVAVYGYDTKTTTASKLNGTTWVSPEITVPAGSQNATVVVDGSGPFASSTLKVQIYVDGALKKESISSGQTLSAAVRHRF
ncbi:hypothetical protein [Taibaiella sp. KBW10]|uniref:hypothetical protein n=1 Tax=Taibaiella sp. KBW10 TaxID=2153357 RepID=UPI0018F2B842|nr:hypothetical protein [Taibaiella sp. KBW10]